MLINRMTRHIPAGRFAAVAILGAAWLLLFARSHAQAGSTGKDNPITSGPSGPVASAEKRHIFFSEYKLRSTVESLNDELRELKRELMRDITSIYLDMKTDATFGFQRALAAAKRADSPQAGPLAFLLMAEEMASIALKRFIIQRRLLAGLKLAYVKFLPLDTLKRLYQRFQSYAFLKDLNQVDLRPSLPAGTGKLLELDTARSPAPS